MSDLFQPSYYPPFNWYPPYYPFYHGYIQHPPPYSQGFIPPPFLPKPPLPLHVPQRPHISAPTSSLRRRLSHQSPPRVQRHTHNLYNRPTTLKRRKPSTRQSPVFPISETSSSTLQTKDRPYDWRSGYKSPSKSYFRRRFESFVIPYKFTTTRSCMLSSLRLNPLLVATQSDCPNIFYDLRKPQIEDEIFLPCLNRLPNTIDFYQLITSPPIHHMTLWHRKLPWQINIEANQPNGITIYDFFQQIHQQLHQPITREEYYTDELAPGDREMLTMAFQIRCAMLPDQSPAGIQRIDFLGQEMCFIGLRHSRCGRWEFKTQLPPPKQRMTID